MAISTNQKPTIYRNLYENTGPALWTGEGYICPLGHERVYLPLGEVADTPFYIQGDVLKKLNISTIFLYNNIYHKKKNISWFIYQSIQWFFCDFNILEQITWVAKNKQHNTAVT